MLLSLSALVNIDENYFWKPANVLLLSSFSRSMSYFSPFSKIMVVLLSSFLTWVHLKACNGWQREKPFEETAKKFGLKQDNRCLQQARLKGAEGMVLLYPSTTPLRRIKYSLYSDRFHMDKEEHVAILLAIVTAFRCWQKNVLPRCVQVSPLTAFSWSDCGATADPVHVSSIKLLPDPLRIPGNVTVGFAGSLSEPLKAPIEVSRFPPFQLLNSVTSCDRFRHGWRPWVGERKEKLTRPRALCLDGLLQLDLKVEKKVLFWITIPCVDNVGSCDYEDVCVLLQQIPCPPEFPKYGIPCSCPFKPVSRSRQLNLLAAPDYFLLLGNRILANIDYSRVLATCTTGVKTPCLFFSSSSRFSNRHSNYRPYYIQCLPFFAPQGEYSLPSATISVEPVGIPSWLADGDYKMTLTFKQQGKEVACLHFELSITK